MSTQPIQGYRTLSADEVALINQVKSTGALVGELMDLLEQRLIRPLPEIDPDGDGTAMAEALYSMTDDEVEAHRWLDLARDHLQQGLMCATRAIARPEGF